MALVLVLLLLACLVCPVHGVEPELVVATGHTDDVTAVAVTADGSLTATGSDDGSVKLWETSTGRVLGTLSLPRKEAGNTLRVTSLWFSPEGRRLASGWSEGHVAVWDVASAQLVTRFEAGESGAQVAYLAGDRVAAVAGTGEVGLWEGGKKNGVVKLPAKGLVLAADRAGGRLAVGCEGTTVLVDPQVLKVRATLQHGRYASARDLAFSPDGDRLAAVLDHDGELVILAGGGKVEQTFRVQAMDASLAWTSAGIVMASQRDGPPLLSVLDPQTGTPLQVLVSSEDYRQFTSLGASQDGTTVVVGRQDSRATVWAGWPPSRAHDLAGASSSVLSLDTREHFVVTGHWDGSVVLWDLQQGRPVQVLEGLDAPVSDVALSPDGLLVAATNLGRGLTRVWERRTGRRMVEHAPAKVRFGQGYAALAFSADSQDLYLGTEGGQVDRLSIDAGQVSTSLAPLAQTGLVHDLALHPAEPTLAAVTSDGWLVEFDLAGERAFRERVVRPVGPLRPEPVSVAYNQDGKLLAVGGADAVIRLYETEYEEDPRLLPAGYGTIHDVAFSPASRTLASAGVDGSILLWSLASLPEKITLKEHRGVVRSLAFTEDGTLVSGGDDAALGLWEKGQLRARALTLKSGQEWVATAPDGRFDGSAGGMEIISWRLGEQLFSLEQFFNRFHHPGLLALGLSAESPSEELEAEALQPPPRVRILAPEPGQRIDEAVAEVTVGVTDTGGGVGEVRLYVNGHRLPDSRKMVVDSQAVKFSVPLVSGPNTLKASAFNDEHSMESRADRIRVSCTAAVPREPVLHILAVGVGEQAASQAKSVGDFFRPGLFSDVKPTVLVDSQASLEGVVRGLAVLEKSALPHDTVLIYLAGVGTLLEGDYYFVTHGADSSSKERVKATALSADRLGEALTRIAATKQLVVLDSTRSTEGAGVLGGYLANRDAVGLSRAQQRLARASGSFLVAGSTGDLAPVMLNGLKEGTVTVNSLLNHVAGQVSGVVQYSTGEDFPLAHGR